MYQNWEEIWQSILNNVPKKIWATDLDGTIWEDTLDLLCNEYSSIDKTSGQSEAAQIYRQYEEGAISFGHLLEKQYQHLLAAKSIDELIEWTKLNVPIFDGLANFLCLLQKNDIGIVAMSNGAKQIVQAKLEHHGLHIPVIANSLGADRLQLVHNEMGLNKALLIEYAMEAGYEIVGFSGDGEADITAANVVSKQGGFLLACGHRGLAHWCKGNLTSDQWMHYNHNFDEVLANAEFNKRIVGRMSHNSVR
jgi:2-hydroxy-3-keto-5-methylthiopentenyl-1-phosphate phosphatase